MCVCSSLHVERRWRQSSSQGRCTRHHRRYERRKLQLHVSKALWTAGCYPRTDWLVASFTSAASAVSDREHFKREISQIIAKNKAAAASAANASASSAPSTAPPTPGPSGIAATINGQFNGLPSPAEAAAAASKVLAAAAANGTRSDTPVASASNGTIMDPTKDWAVRQRLLKKNADLRQLHIDLVRTGQISEEEFWEGREQLLVAEAIQHSQIRGRNAQLVDPKPEQGDNGEVKIKLSQQLIKDIFEQYPIVAKVYNDNVPEPVSLLEDLSLLCTCLTSCHAAFRGRVLASILSFQAFRPPSCIRRF